MNLLFSLKRLQAMANFTSCIRSNQFKVKDRESFALWIENDLEGELSIDFVAGENKHDQVVIYGYSDIPNFDADGKEINFLETLASHLQDKEVAIIFMIGSEKLRYLVGLAWAVYHTGETLEINLDEIYSKAADNFIGSNIREAW